MLPGVGSSAIFFKKGGSNHLLRVICIGNKQNLLKKGGGGGGGQNPDSLPPPPPPPPPAGHYHVISFDEFMSWSACLAPKRQISQLQSHTTPNNIGWEMSQYLLCTLGYPALDYSAPQLFGTSINRHGKSLHFGCALIRKHVEFASSVIENVLISVIRTFHLSK